MSSRKSTWHCARQHTAGGSNCASNASRGAERHDWIRAMLMGEELRPLDGDVFRVDRIAKTLAPVGVDRWAKEHKFFEGLDRLRQNLDEIARTDFADG